MLPQLMSLLGLSAAYAVASPSLDLLARHVDHGVTGSGVLPRSQLAQSRSSPAQRDLEGLTERALINIEREFDIGFSLENEVLFDGSSLPILGLPITVVCAKCCSKGTVKASLNDEDNFLNPVMRFDLRGVELFVSLDVVLDGEFSFKLTLFELPPGTVNFEIPGLDGGPRAGLFFSIDLIFTVTAGIDLNTGFFVKLPDTAFFQASLLDGVLTELSFGGIQSKSLPITVNNLNDTTVQVDLQFRAEIVANLTLPFDLPDIIPDINIPDIPNIPDINIPGIPDIPGLPIKERSDAIVPRELGVPPSLRTRVERVDTRGLSLQERAIGAGVGVGVFINVVELIATLSTKSNCTLEAVETFNINAGAFFQAEADLGFTDFNFAPTVSTTFFQGPAFTQCLIPPGVASIPSRLLPLPTPVTSCINSPVARPIKTLSPQPLTTVAPTTSCAKNQTTNATAAFPITTLGNMPSVATQLMTICGVAAVNCPPDLQSVVPFPTTICGTIATKSGVCVPVTDATEIPAATSPITNTFVLPTPSNPPTKGAAFNTTTTISQLKPLVTSTGLVYYQPNVTNLAPGTTGAPAITSREVVFTAGAERASRIWWVGVAAVAVAWVVDWE